METKLSRRQYFILLAVAFVVGFLLPLAISLINRKFYVSYSEYFYYHPKLHDQIVRLLSKLEPIFPYLSITFLIFAVARCNWKLALPFAAPSLLYFTYFELETYLQPGRLIIESSWIKFAFNDFLYVLLIMLIPVLIILFLKLFLRIFHKEIPAVAVALVAYSIAHYIIDIIFSLIDNGFSTLNHKNTSMLVSHLPGQFLRIGYNIIILFCGYLILYAIFYLIGKKKNAPVKITDAL